MRRRLLLPLLAALASGAPSAARADDPAPRVERAIPGAELPQLTVDARGAALLSWVERGADGERVLRVATRSPDGAWSAEDATRTVATGHAPLVVTTDPPTVRAAPDGGWYATWLVRPPGTPFGTSHVMVARSTDGGASFGEPRVAHDDRSPTEHGFASFLPAADGGLALAWLDGRATASGGPAALRTVSLDALFADDPDEQVLDPRVCDCCATDAVATPEGGALVVYRDRDADELRDIAVVRRADGSFDASRAVARDGWRIAGCPVNGPAADASGDVVWVAWYTAADEERPRIRAARSDDGGASFGAAVDLASGEAVRGQVDVVATDDGGAIVTWVAHEGGRDLWRARRLDAAAGAVGEPRELAELASSRSRPRAVRAGDRMLLAWVRGGDAPAVVAATLPLQR